MLYEKLLLQVLKFDKYYDLIEEIYYLLYVFLNKLMFDKNHCLIKEFYFIIIHIKVPV